MPQLQIVQQFQGFCLIVKIVASPVAKYCIAYFIGLPAQDNKRRYVQRKVSACGLGAFFLAVRRKISLLEKHPEETYECIMALCVRDEGEPEPDGIELLMAAFNLVSDQRVLDFLLQLGKSGLIATEA